MMRGRPATGPRHRDDVELVRRVLAGSVRDWHTFIDVYGGLIERVIRRTLYDQDEVRSAFVDVLVHLRTAGFREYSGRSRLSTWLAVVARRQAIDTLRHRLGRRELPRALASLSTFDRRVYALCHVEGLALDVVRDRLRVDGTRPSIEAIVDALDRIDARLDRRSRRRVAYDREAAFVGAESGRLLEFLDHQRAETEEAGKPWTADHELLRREAERMRDRVRRLVEKLPDQERRALSLRYESEWGARDIAKQLGLGSRRQAYTVLDRALRRLRRWLESGVLP